MKSTIHNFFLFPKRAINWSLASATALSLWKQLQHMIINRMDSVTYNIWTTLSEYLRYTISISDAIQSPNALTDWIDILRNCCKYNKTWKKETTTEDNVAHLNLFIKKIVLLISSRINLTFPMIMKFNIVLYVRCLSLFSFMILFIT